MSWGMHPDEALQPLTDNIVVDVRPEGWLWLWEIRHERDGLMVQPVGRGYSGWAFTMERAFRKGKNRIAFLRRDEEKKAKAKFFREVV